MDNMPLQTINVSRLSSSNCKSMVISKIKEGTYTVRKSQEEPIYQIQATVDEILEAVNYIADKFNKPISVFTV